MGIVEFQNVSRVYKNGDHEQWALNHVNSSRNGLYDESDEGREECIRYDDSSFIVHISTFSTQNTRQHSLAGISLSGMHSQLHSHGIRSMLKAG